MFRRLFCKPRFPAESIFQHAAYLEYFCAFLISEIMEAITIMEQTVKDKNHTKQRVGGRLFS